MKRLIPIFAAELLLTACAGAPAPPPLEAEYHGEPADTATEPAETQDTGTVNSEPVQTEAPVSHESYTNYAAGLLTEMPPEDIFVRREGVTYTEFQKVLYYSHFRDREDTPLNILLPADYTEDKVYPVLYVLHGSEDNEDWMTQEDVHISVMLNNLIADGEAKEMIVVSPYIYCSRDSEGNHGLTPEDFQNFDNFRSDLLNDIKPYIEAHYSVGKGPEYNAITGFSIGGRESLYTGFSYPEKFGFIGSICAASGVVAGTGEPHALEPDQFTFEGREQPYLLLMSAAEQDQAVFQIPYTYHDILTENGTNHLWHEMHETGHDVRSVSAHLYNFLRMIFQESEY